MEKMPGKSDETRLFHIVADRLNHAPVPPYGFIDHFLIRPQRDCLNVNASQLYVIAWKLVDPFGAEIPCDVQMIGRGLEATNA